MGAETTFDQVCEACMDYASHIALGINFQSGDTVVLNTVSVVSNAVSVLSKAVSVVLNTASDDVKHCFRSVTNTGFAAAGV
jgi:hypothetical protein